MACECKDENGSLREKCLGVCKNARQTIIVEDQRRANFELTFHNDMQQMALKISALAQQITNLPKLIIEANNKGYRDGFKDGYESGRDY